MKKCYEFCNGQEFSRVAKLAYFLHLSVAILLLLSLVYCL